MSPEWSQPSGSIVCLGGCLVAVIAVHHHGTPEHQFTPFTRAENLARIVDVDHPHLVARIGDSDGAGLARSDGGIGAGRAGQFGHAPDLMNRTSNPFGELNGLGRRQRLAAGPAPRQAGQVVISRNRDEQADSNRPWARHP